MSSLGRTVASRSELPCSLLADLPVELLTEIFVIVASLVHRSACPTAWMDLQLVCKRWNAIIRQTARFWKVIHVRPNLQGLTVCMDRASTGTLDLHFCGLRPSIIRKAIDLITPHMHRIRALYVQVNGENELRESGVPDLFTAHTSMPALEELSILPVEWRSKVETPLTLSAAALPRLHTLALSGVSLPRSPSFYARMRSLALHEHCCTTDSLNLDDLVDALAAAAPHLEELDLARFSPRLTDADHRPLARELKAKCIPLPRLRSLYLDNSFPVAARLLTHLVPSPEATVYLRVRMLSAVQNAYSRNGTGRTLLSALGTPGVCSVFDRAVSMVVSFALDRFCIKAQVSAPGRVPRQGVIADTAEATFVLHNLSENGFGLPMPLSAVLGLCAPSRLTSLKVMALESHGSRTNAMEYASVFEALPLLERLTALGVSVGEVFVALSTPLRASGPGVDTAVGGSILDHRAAGGSLPEGADVVCPLLQRLGFELPWDTNTKDFVPAAVECLSLRARHGARLTSLSVNCSRIELGDVTRLEMFVDELQLAD